LPEPHNLSSSVNLSNLFTNNKGGSDKLVFQQTLFASETAIHM